MGIDLMACIIELQSDIANKTFQNLFSFMTFCRAG